MCIIGLSSVDHMPFVSTSESSKSGDAVTKLDFTYDSFVKEEIIDVDDEDVIDHDIHSIEENATIIQQPPLLKTTPRTVVISSKQSNGPIAIHKPLSKPVFIPINLSNVKTIKVRNCFLKFYLKRSIL